MKTSFDVFLSDGSSVTAESAGIRPVCNDPSELVHVWSLHLYGPEGRYRESLGTKLGNRDEIMCYAESMAEILEGVKS